jgi:hypothetical protein
MLLALLRVRGIVRALLAAAGAVVVLPLLTGTHLLSLLRGLPGVLLGLRLATMLLAALLVLMLLAGARRIAPVVRLARPRGSRLILLLLGHSCPSFHE